MTKKLNTLLFSLLILVSSVFSQTGLGDQTDRAKILAPGTVAGWIYSDGRIFRNPQGNSGLEYPSNSNQYAIYAAGLWIGAKVDGDVRTAINEYYTTFENGPIGADGKTVDKGASKWKLYTITKTQANDPTSPEFVEWMSMEQYGAPTWTDPADNIKKPRVFGDMNFWSVYNDANVSHGDTGSDPLGAEVNQLSWSYARPDVLGDAIFLKYTVINKSGKQWSDTYFSLWSDPDLGDAGDDFVGCDTLKSLGFVYNASASGQLGKYAAGYDFLQGPIVPKVGSTANFNFETVQDYENLPMSSYMTYINGSATWGDPGTKDEMYQYMIARNKVNDDATTYPGFPAGSSLVFLLTGDPESNTGFLDSNPGDRRLMMTTGPFEMADGDVQEVVVGFLVSRGSDHLNAVTALKGADALVQQAYDLKFNLAAPPKAPAMGQVGVAHEDYKPIYSKTADGKVAITLNWQSSDENYAEIDNFTKEYNEYFATFIADTSDHAHYADLLAEAKTLKFSGYIVTQYPTSGRRREDGKRVAIFDDPAAFNLTDRNGNALSTYFTFTADLSTGALVYQPVFNSQGRGLSKSITMTTDVIAQKDFVEGKTYYFDVKAFASNPWSATGIFESGDAKLIRATPKFPDAGVVANAAKGDTLAYTKVGGSDGFVLVTVEDPYSVTGADYKVTFNADATWNLIRNNTDTLVSHNTNQPTDLSASNDYPIVDGLKVRVSGAPNAFTDFRVTANANGVLDPPAGAAAEYRSFPGLGRTNIANQQASGNQYLLAAVGASADTYSATVARWTQYSGGYNGSGKHGLEYLVPNDYEIRFTAAGSMAVEDWAASKTFVHVPFELWNIGDPNDPSDDFKMIALILDRDGSGTWNLIPNSNHGISSGAADGGTDDPYSEDIFWIEPNDHTPGTAGYDALIAMDPTTFSSLMWADQNALTTHVMRSFVIVGFNAGTDYTLPETGTVFRIATSKPNSVSDSFTFTAPSPATIPAGGSSAGITSLKNVKVVPNPFYAFHDDIQQNLEQTIYFTNLPDKATIRIFTLNGELAKKIDYNAAVNGTEGSKYKYSVSNNSDLPLASGMYIYHIEAPSMDAVYGKFAVIRSEERLSTY